MALFFHDTYGGDVVAVLWKPHAFKSKPFKVSLYVHRRLVAKGSYLTLVRVADSYLTKLIFNFIRREKLYDYFFNIIALTGHGYSRSST